MTQKTALITGIGGQDGRLLAEHLLKSGYRVVGVSRPGRGQTGADTIAGTQSDDTDLTDAAAVMTLVQTWQPNEIYHLAAFHHSSQENSRGAALTTKDTMLATNFMSTKNLAFAMLEKKSQAHLVFAASSQMFTAEKITHEIDESSRRKPSTFYGLTKSWSADLLASLRAEHGIRASTAILFNHESPLRGEQFVSRKITRAAALAKLGKAPKLTLQNIGARADWSSARDVVRALHMLGSTPNAQDLVVASGVLHSVQDMLDAAFKHVGLDWRDHVVFERNVTVPALVGRPDKIREALEWQPTINFSSMIEEMVRCDLGLEPGHTEITDDNSVQNSLALTSR